MAGITMNKMQGRDKGSDEISKDMEARRSGTKAKELEAAQKGTKVAEKTESQAGVFDRRVDGQVAATEDKPVEEPKAQQAGSNKPAKGSDYPKNPGPHAPGSENHPAPGVPKNSRVYDKTKPSTFA